MVLHGEWLLMEKMVVLMMMVIMVINESQLEVFQTLKLSEKSTLQEIRCSQPLF